MNKDKLQDKYNEIFQNIKEEQLEWNFEDFLTKTQEKKEEETLQDLPPVIPIDKKNKNVTSKWFWVAASFALLIGTGFVFNHNKNSDIETQAKLVENQIKLKKKDFIEENNETIHQVVTNHVSDSISTIKEDSIFHKNTLAENDDAVDAILSKRGRMKKEKKTKYVDNSPSKSVALQDSTTYRDSYVTVNGKNIKNLEEAINVTKYSFQVFANNINEKLVHASMIEDDF